MKFLIVVKLGVKYSFKKILPKSTSLIICFSVLFSLIITLETYAQELPEGDLVINNYASNNYLDVKLGSLEPKAKVWMFKLNQTDAQYFRFIKIGSQNDKVFRIQNIKSNLFLTARMVLSISMDAASSSQNNSNIYLTQDHAYEISNRPQIDIMSVDAKNQYWELMSAEIAENGTLFILKNVRFNKVLEPFNNQSKSSLILNTYVQGKISQAWKISAMPKIPKSVRVDYSYKVQSNRISGVINWSDQSNNESGFSIWADRTYAGGVPYSFEIVNFVPANTTSYSFTFNETNSLNGKNREHCFYVFALGSGGFAPNSLPSKNVCSIAHNELSSPPPPPPPVGISSIHVYNCHSEQRAVRLWTYDLTLDNGIWVDRGQLSSQWSNGSCQSGLPNLPKQISLTDGHSYALKAIDCGNNPPNTTDGSCHKLTTTNAIPGKTGGQILTITVQ